MSEDKTAQTPDPRSFEERVFSRFDALDARLNDLDTRLQRLEAKQYDTKPIWERALAELIEMGGKIDNIERKINVLGQDMIQLRADQARTESRLEKLEAK
jgi:archaellum component FlaC